MKYELLVSHDLGVTYSKLESADALKDLDGLILELEAQGMRWYITEGDKIQSYGKFQKSYIEMVLSEQKKKPKEGMMVTTDDPMVRKVLEGHGIEVKGTVELMALMTGKSIEECQALSDSAPKINQLSDEDKEKMLETLGEWKDKGILKTHDDTKGEIDGFRNT